jgi:hypothetical protein
MGKPLFANRRLVIAMSSYLVLAIVAIAGLDGYLRGGVLLLLALLAIKTCAHAGDERMQ